ncbi:ribonuclease III domain-containing protein [Cytidiella melzeri]|nr:ribonuclease III domain-containing protein [Cytidiella melzeri]
MVKAPAKGLSMHSDSYKWSSSTTGPASDLKTTSSHNFSHPNLKRQRSDLSTAPSSHTSSGAKMSALPSIPKLNGEVLLDVFTHRSLRFQGAPLDDSSEYGDNIRLAVLGKAILHAAAIDTLFKKRPMLKADEIEEQLKVALSLENVERWLKEYKLRDKLRCSPDAVALLDRPDEMNLLFNSYVGAVYASQGMPVVQNWIGALIDPDYESIDVDVEPLNFAKKVKIETFSPPPSAYPSYHTPAPAPEPASMPPPPPPANPPPPLPNPMTPAQPSTAFLPMFNQTANQRRVFVEYPAQFAGPPHAGRWTVKCVVNGIEKGVGAGASKQLAKEEAAKQAWYAMGWAARA